MKKITTEEFDARKENKSVPFFQVVVVKTITDLLAGLPGPL